MLAREIVFGTETKKRYYFEFKFSPIQPMHVPMSTSVIHPPQAVPSNAPRDTVCLVADGALRCPTAKASWRNRAIVKIILGQNTGQKPKLVLLEIAWLPSFYHLALHGETLLVRRPIQMTNNHDILHQEECKGETELINFCKALDTWIYNVNKCDGQGSTALV